MENGYIIIKRNVNRGGKFLEKKFKEMEKNVENGSSWSLTPILIMF